MATWYVHQSVGIDNVSISNQGTIDTQPFQTISYTVGQASSGDTIRIKGGGEVYSEGNIDVTKALHLRAYATDKWEPIIKMTGVSFIHYKPTSHTLDLGNYVPSNISEHPNAVNWTSAGTGDLSNANHACFRLQNLIITVASTNNNSTINALIFEPAIRNEFMLQPFIVKNCVFDMGFEPSSMDSTTSPNYNRNALYRPAIINSGYKQQWKSRILMFACSFYRCARVALIHGHSEFLVGDKGQGWVNSSACRLPPNKFEKNVVCQVGHPSNLGDGTYPYAVYTCVYDPALGDTTDLVLCHTYYCFYYGVSNYVFVEGVTARHPLASPSCETESNMHLNSYQYQLGDYVTRSGGVLFNMLGTSFADEDSYSHDLSGAGPPWDSGDYPEFGTGFFGWDFSSGVWTYAAGDVPGFSGTWPDGATNWPENVRAYAQADSGGGGDLVYKTGGSFTWADIDDGLQDEGTPAGYSAFIGQQESYIPRAGTCYRCRIVASHIERDGVLNINLVNITDSGTPLSYAISSEEISRNYSYTSPAGTVTAYSNTVDFQIPDSWGESSPEGPQDINDWKLVLEIPASSNLKCRIASVELRPSSSYGFPFEDPDNYDFMPTGTDRFIGQLADGTINPIACHHVTSYLSTPIMYNGCNPSISMWQIGSYANPINDVVRSFGVGQTTVEGWRVLATVWDWDDHSNSAPASSDKFYEWSEPLHAWGTYPTQYNLTVRHGILDLKPPVVRVLETHSPGGYTWAVSKNDYHLAMSDLNRFHMSWEVLPENSATLATGSSAVDTSVESDTGVKVGFVDSSENHMILTSWGLSWGLVPGDFDPNPDYSFWGDGVPPGGDNTIVETENYGGRERRMSAGKHNIVVEQGANFKRVLIWKDSAGAAVNLTGYSAAMMIKKRKGDASGAAIFNKTDGNSEIDLGTTNGTITINIPGADTASMDFDWGYWDLELNDGSGNITRLLEGRVKLSKEVTY